MMKVYVHNRDDNVSGNIEDLYHQKEESKLEETFQHFVICLVSHSVVLVVAHCTNQYSERKDGRRNREDYAVGCNKYYRV